MQRDGSAAHAALQNVISGGDRCYNVLQDHPGGLLAWQRRREAARAASERDAR